MTGDVEQRLRDHRRTELHVHDHTGRTLRLVVFSWGIACSCRPGVDTYDCEHAKHARRILDEPCRVACEQIVRLWAEHSAGTDPDARAAYAAEAYRTAHDALKRDDERVTHSLWLLDQALDTRTQEQVEKDAVRLLDSVSGVDRRPNILTERAAALRAAKEQP